MMRFDFPSWTITSPRDWQKKAFDAVWQHYSEGRPNGIVSAIMGAGKSILIDELCACVQTTDSIVVSTSSQRLTEDLYASISKRCGTSKTVGIWYGGRKRIGQVVVCCNDSLRQLAEKLKQLGKVVSLWIGDEIHRSETSQILDAVPILSPLNSIGFTATAFRSCPKETISLFKKIIFRYGVADAVKDKVVVPWKIENWYGEDRELDESCLEMIRKKTNGPGLANASTIQDAVAFAEFLSQNGVPSKAIHSQCDLRAQNILLRLLKDGELRCIVHVNILSEGANFPWLRWLCMRRQVGARVRFIQEIGRLLRSHPGKEYATFLDPHDLFGSFNLSYAEALGEAQEEPEIEVPSDPRELANRIAGNDPALSLALIESTIRTLVVACDVNGILCARKPIKKTDRLQPSNDLQHAAMRMGIKRVQPLANDGWQACLNEIGKRPSMLRFGFAAEMQLALDSICRAKKWPEIGSDLLISGLPEEKEQREILVADKTGQFHVDWGKL